MTKVYLHFEGGRTFPGHTQLNSDDHKLKRGIWGEAAFTTAMSGYQETITDPSYLGQHIIFSYPHIGNYPPDPRVMQHHRSSAVSIIAREFYPNSFLESLGLPLISGIDTRDLVKFISSGHASEKSLISLSPKAPSEEEFARASLLCNDLSLVSQEKKEVVIPGERPIVLINYGIKKAILEEVKALGLPLVTLPYNARLEEITALKPRLVFLSNGPGDPALYLSQIEVVKGVLQAQIPLRAICLGHQLVSLALGARTYRLPYGHRGANHPVLDHTQGKVLITSQNHGYTIEEKSLAQILRKNFLNKDFFISHSSLFDQSVEGIASTDHSIKTVQFHPEASPGPTDAREFFAEVGRYLREQQAPAPVALNTLSPIPDLSQKRKKQFPFQRVLIIGSGPIKIGQASEFDYSGTQACRALKEEGLTVILLNSNPATIMTDKELAHRTYVEPITKETIKNIIKKEKVEAILSTMGGQTALNLSLELEREGYLREANVKLLGANASTIEKTEDRELFAEELDRLGYHTGKRVQVQNRQEAFEVAEKKVGFPLIIRRNFALGGQGAALIADLKELNENIDPNFKFPVTLEKSLYGYKEVELEVMVDGEQNGVVVCSIENVDPCGVHTGDSITVAPVQSISDRCYQNLRTMALTIAKVMGVVAGGANVQFAIHPEDEDDIVVIEMNPRVSRSSALASKATGYPIAKISALLAVGYTLKEILNDITKVSPVCFEPTLDYVAVKIPLFPFSKFPVSSAVLGPQMRSVGEVLALGSNFNEAFLKALRSLELGLDVPHLGALSTTAHDMNNVEVLRERLKSPQELSLLAVIHALRAGISTQEIFSLSKISPWFIAQMEELVRLEKEIESAPEKLLSSAENFCRYKAQGFSDLHLAQLSGSEHQSIVEYRKAKNIFPVFKAVDTCSGEFQALTPYFYATYQAANEVRPFKKEGHKAIAILGSGPNRIGQGIEFDYSCVKACQTLKKEKLKSIMINSNPETVSTDYDSSDRLYLSPLHAEDLWAIFHHESPQGIVAAFSGQTGIKVRMDFEKTFMKNELKLPFLGSPLKTLDLCEDRNLFDKILAGLPIHKTTSFEVKSYSELLNTISKIGMPVMVRPSYVIGGESMFIVRHWDDLGELSPKIKEALAQGKMILQVENYLENALEYDVDLVRDQYGNVIYSICEHIEYAGVHSGDSGMVTPPLQMSAEKQKELRQISLKLAEILGIVGPVNFQFALKDEKIYCIEANPRGSRTLPFLSKAYDLPLAGLALLSMLGKEIPNSIDKKIPYYCVKQSTFPFDRFLQDSSLLGPKMRSTGETMGLDPLMENALLKSYLGNFPKMETGKKILFSLSDQSKPVILPYLAKLQKKNMEFYATNGTCQYIREQGFPCVDVRKLGQDGFSIPELLKDKGMAIVFNAPLNQGKSVSDGAQIRANAIANGVACFTRLENIEAVLRAFTGHEEKMVPLCLQEIS